MAEKPVTPVKAQDRAGLFQKPLPQILDGIIDELDARSREHIANMTKLNDETKAHADRAAAAAKKAAADEIELLKAGLKKDMGDLEKRLKDAVALGKAENAAENAVTEARVEALEGKFKSLLAGLIEAKNAEVNSLNALMERL